MFSNMIPSTAENLHRAIEEALRAEYERGWDDAMAALVQTASGKRPKPSKAAALADLSSRITAREAITQALQARPGMQAAEIYRWAEAQGFSVTFEAIRAAIKRLRQSESLIRSGVGYALKPNLDETVTSVQKRKRT